MSEGAGHTSGREGGRDVISGRKEERNHLSADKRSDFRVFFLDTD